MPAEARRGGTGPGPTAAKGIATRSVAPPALAAVAKGWRYRGEIGRAGGNAAPTNPRRAKARPDRARDAASPPLTCGAQPLYSYSSKLDFDKWN